MWKRKIEKECCNCHEVTIDGFERQRNITAYTDYYCRECLTLIYEGKLEDNNDNSKWHIPVCTGKLFQYTSISCNGSSPMDYGYRNNYWMPDGGC